jgi:hypothetical protein
MKRVLYDRTSLSWNESRHSLLKGHKRGHWIHTLSCVINLTVSSLGRLVSWVKWLKDNQDHRHSWHSLTETKGNKEWRECELRVNENEMHFYPSILVCCIHSLFHSRRIILEECFLEWESQNESVKWGRQDLCPWLEYCGVLYCMSSNKTFLVVEKGSSRASDCWRESSCYQRNQGKREIDGSWNEASFQSSRVIPLLLVSPKEKPRLSIKRPVQ